MRGYDPYPYRPLLRYFYSGAPLPQDVADAVTKNPGAANHIQAAFGFTQWLNERFPEVSQSLAVRNPNALNPIKAVSSGVMSPKKTMSGLSGLGDLVDSTPATDWGKTIADAAKSLLAYKSQSDLVNMNIKRAEQGLPPIDSSTLAPTVNVGISPQVTQLAYVAVGGLLLFGLFSAFKSARR